MSPRVRRVAWISLGAAAATLLAAVLASIILLRSQWFHSKVRARMIAEVENATGGRAELATFRFDWRTLEAHAGGFVLHGREQPGEPAFLRVAEVTAGIKVVSAIEKDVDLASLIVERPEVHVILYPDGSTNLPEPAVKRRRPAIAEQLLNLAVRRFELRNGIAELSGRRVPFDIRGDDLSAAFDYDPDGPQYRGHVSSRRLLIEARDVRPVAFDFDSDVVLTAAELRIARSSFTTGRSRLTASGSIFQWDDPRAEVTFDSDVFLPDLGNAVKLPVEPAGEATLQGTAVLRWGKGFDYRATGRVQARGLAYRDRRVRVAGIGARGGFEFRPGALVLPDLTATALGGTFHGRAELADRFERVQADGVVAGISLAELPRALVTQRELPWSGTASGPVRMDGRIAPGPPHDFTIQANMNVAPAGGPNPIQGSADVIYDQRVGTLRLGDCRLATRATRVEASGTLGQSLRASIDTSDLEDLRPGLKLIGADVPERLPLKLAGGRARAQLAIIGDLANPTITGRVSVGTSQVHGRTIDSAEGVVKLTRDGVQVRNLVARQRGMTLRGTGSAGLSDWRIEAASAISASLAVTGADVQALLADAGEKLPVAGTASASGEVSGTFGSPAVSMTVSVDRPAGWEESFDQLRAEARIDTHSVHLANGELRGAHGRLKFSADYRRAGSDWRSGSASFNVEGGGVRIEELNYVRKLNSRFAGVLSLKATGNVHLRNAVLDLDSLDGLVTVSGITRGKAPFGSFSAAARTRGGVLTASLDGAVRGSPVKGSGDWTLKGDYPGRGEFQFNGLSFASLQAIIQLGDVQRELPFVGVVDGRGVISGPLRRPDELRTEVTLPRVQVNANPNQTLRAGARLQDLALRNTEPVRMVASLKAVDIRSARFAATDTSLEAAGRVTFDAKSPWDVTVQGRMNLAILQLVNSDLAARGNAVLNTTIRGPLTDPQVGGRLELNKASLYLADLPPSLGVDNVNGLVTFDRNRANIEKLSGEVGGGRISFGGFIGFGGGILLYRVLGNAEQVRLRHPDGFSVTLNAAVNLTGTSENGLVSGTITVIRAAVETDTDLGSILAQSAMPLPAPSVPSEYLRGLNFDIRIESGANLEVQTSLTRDLEAEAELRLRGNAARPALSGDISVSQGVIQFLGNKYTVNHAEIRFINPTKVEPVFDVDLETKARGITVNISFSGTVNKLNVTYRSDPPLQSSDIIALLAVGRDPNVAAVANAQTRSNLLETGASTLSQAVAAPVSNRLQRFFGVSRLKIDPSLTGVDNIPEARVTLEQQVSRDITLTYVTNLARTQEQIVRVQWDMNRQWSAIAVREENGVFGIDFQYRKRFK